MRVEAHQAKDRMTGQLISRVKVGQLDIRAYHLIKKVASSIRHPVTAVLQEQAGLGQTLLNLKLKPEHAVDAVCQSGLSADVGTAGVPDSDRI